MNVFKFGGASVKDASAVRNVVQIMRQNLHEPICIVVSAMGKTTNALEQICNAYFNQTGEAVALLEQLKANHFQLFVSFFPTNVIPLKMIWRIFLLNYTGLLKKRR